MVMGGATKLPNGGIGFTSHRSISKNGWGATLYVTDKDYRITGKYQICDSPMAPKLVGNSLLIGSTAIEKDLSHKLNVYDATTFKLKKEYFFTDMVDGWRITGHQGEAYFGAIDSRIYDSYHSHFFQINLNTLEIKDFYQDVDILKGVAALQGWIEKDKVYLTNGDEKDMGVLNISTGEYTHIISLINEREISNKNMRFIFNPVKIDNNLYAIMRDYDTDSGYFAYVVNVDLIDNTLKTVTKLPFPRNTSDISKDTLMCDGLFVIRVDDKVYFIDLTTATIEHVVKLDE
jgi:hypothetical protein